MIGYKVMRTDGVLAISLADSRQKFKLKKGLDVRFKGKGIYVSTNEQYVLDYYSSLTDSADNEVLLVFSFDPIDITSGNLEDREPEITLRKATLKNWRFLGEITE